jgi:predicted amidohydrolase YtcJ
VIGSRWRSRHGGPALVVLLVALVGGCVDSTPGVTVPAFVDHHVHVFNVGWYLLQDGRREPTHVFAEDAGSEAEVVQRATAAAAVATSGEAGAAGIADAWVTGFGWNQEAWGTAVLPTATALSAAVPRVPVALARTDGHALWVNDAALAAAGIRMSGNAGVLLERDVESVVGRIPAPPDSDVVAAWRLGAEALASRGVLRAYDAGVLALPGVAAMNTDFARYVRLLADADRERALPLALYLMIPAPSAYAESVLAMSPEQRQLSPNVRITHLKLFADGALGSRGAALSHPYADDPHTYGVLRMTAAEIAEWTRRALDAGLDVATHAIGDRAVNQTLDAYEQVLRERPDLVPTRLRIEHFSYASESDIGRAVRLGVALSIQSNFNTPRGISPTFADQRVGAEHAADVYAWDRLDRMGALLVEGSDYFGAPGPALLGMHAGLTGINAIGDRGDTPAVRQRLLRMAGAWLAAGGTLMDPADAGDRTVDHIVLSADPLTVPLDSMTAIRVLSVVREGREVHRGSAPQGRE